MNIKKRIAAYYNQKLKPSRILALNRGLKDTCPSKRCFVLGNGTSLNRMNLKKLKGEYTFVVNRFFFHPDFDLVNPTYYNHIESIRNLQPYPKDHSCYLDNYYMAIEKAFRFKQTKLFFNIESKPYVEKNRLFTDHEVYYLAGYESLLTSKTPEADISKPNSFMDGVIYSSICVAAYMGFKTIYLIGCDFDHILNKKEAHFHADKEKTLLDGASNKDLACNLYLYLSKMERIRSFFEQQGVHIYNAGIGGMTDTFERKKYDDLFLSPTFP